MGSVRVPETGEWVECPEISVNLPVQMPTVIFGEKPVPVTQALSMLAGLRDYWRARALRFETELADERSRKAEL